MRIVFMGTPHFAVPSLTALVGTHHDVVAVFTQPDKPVGRKQELAPPAIKVVAQRHELQVFQPETFRAKACAPLLEKLAPDAIVVVAYGKILPRHVLVLPQFGCINVHASLLPRYRGAAPIQWAVLEGEEVTGVTTMYMDAGIDTGDVILQREAFIGEHETSESLHERLGILGAELLVQTLALVEKGEAPRTAQDDTLATYAPMLDKSMTTLDFSKPARTQMKMVCAAYPWPVASTRIRGKVLKVYEAKVGFGTSSPAGTAVQHAEGISVACGDGLELILTEVQLEGSLRMPGGQFLRGRPIREPIMLGI